MTMSILSIYTVHFKTRLDSLFSSPCIGRIPQGEGNIDQQ